MKIKFKIASLPLLSTIVFCVIFIVSDKYNRQNEKLILLIEKGHSPALQLSLDLEVTLSNIQRSLRNGVASSEEEVILNTDTISSLFIKLLATGENNPVIDIEYLNLLKVHYSGYYKIAKTTSLSMIRGDAGSDLVKNMQSMISKYRKLKKQLSLDSENRRVKIKKEFEYTRNNVKKAKMLNIIIISLSVCIMVLFSLLIIKNITEPIKIMFSDISDGESDLTKKINVTTNDEFGTLAGYFNTFIEKLRIIIESVAKNSSTLAGSTENLSQTISKINLTSRDISSQSNTVAAAAEESTTILNSMAKDAETMSFSVTSVAKSIEEMNISINEVAQNCQRESDIALNANTQIKETKEKMDTLGIAAKEISKIIETINNIADKTNLLALNATIEAASAGEAGKGFGVVAIEVKELAKQTAQATDQIQKQIENMQDITLTSVSAIGSITETIKEVNDISQTIARTVEEQSTNLNEIADNVSGASNSAQEIAKNISVTAQGLNEVTSSIHGVNSGIIDTVKSIDSVNSTVIEMQKLATNLDVMVKQFKV